MNLSKGTVYRETEPEQSQKASTQNSMISCGDYTGGELILYDLEIILELKAEDMIVFQDAVIHHNNNPAQGNRCSVMAFTQENVYNYWNRKYNMILRRKERKKSELKVKE